MNGLDIVVILVVLVSGLFAFARGFVKEALSVGAWVGAGLAALYAFPYVRPVAERFLPKGPLADTAAGIAVFLVALVVLSLVTSAIAGRVKGSALSALDRTLGLIFGLARGAVLMCLAYIALSWVLPPNDRPDWMQKARTLPLLANGADILRSLVPGSLRERAAAKAQEAAQSIEQAKQVEGAIRALSTPKPAPAPPAPTGPARGYNDDSRRDLNRLIQQNAQ